MTIRKILELIDLIKSKIGANSFSQKLQDYIVTIQNNSNNLVLLKELTDKSIMDYQKLLDDNVKEMLERVLVTNIKPFTNNINTYPNPTIENGVKLNEDGYSFKVQIGAFKKQVPNEIVAKYLTIKITLESTIQD